MTDGELLFNAYMATAPNYGGPPWCNLPPFSQSVWENAATLFLMRLAGSAPTIPVRNWKAEFDKFGRHLPDCGYSAFFETACTCGFAEIERELAA